MTMQTPQQTAFDDPEALSLRTIFKCNAHQRNSVPSWPGKPTAEAARSARLRLTTSLQLAVKSDHLLLPLQHALEACRPGRRCLSGGCPECRGIFQEWAVSQICRLAAKAKQSGLHLVAVSIAIPGAHASGGQLSTLDLAVSRRTLETAWNTATANDPRPALFAAFGADFSFNIDTAKGLGCQWQGQFYGIAAVISLAKLKTALREQFQPTSLVKHPVHIKKCDGSARAAAYAFKTVFFRRSSYWDKNLKPPSWNARHFNLKVHQQIELAQYLHKLGFHDRAVFLNLEMALVADQPRLAISCESMS